MSSSTNPLRVGLIGYGFAGRTLHAPLLAATPGLALTTFGSSKPDLVHQDFPTARVLAPDAVPTDPDLDLVVIATPNACHHPLAAAALRSGKHVVLDKPFTVTLAEARDLRQIAAAAGRNLSVFHNRRYDSEVLSARQAIASGALGDITHFECHMDRFRPVVRQRWREDPGPGAGLWFDLGPHLIDLALHLFGLPDSVSASFATLRPGGRTEDWAHVILTYPGLRAILHATLLAPGTGGPRTLLHGTRATWFRYGEPDLQEIQLKAGISPLDPAFGVAPTPSFLIDGDTGVQTELPSPPGNERLFYAAVRDAILHGTPPPIPARDAVAVMAILETSFQSGAEGKVLLLPLTPGERAEWTTAHRAL